MKTFWAWICSWFKKTPKPPVVVPDDPVTKPTPAGALVPIKLAHGAACHVPMCDKSNRNRGTEKIRRLGPFNDFRTLEVGDDAFLDGFIMDAVRLQDNVLCGDDREHSGVVYVFDHFSIKTSSNKTTTNPLNLDEVDKGCFRAWWRCYSK